MIFISGVHGVGKSYFCNLIKDKLGIETYTASSLISERKKQPFAADKLVPDIDINQQFLLAAVDELRTSGTNFVLDGHFCLLNQDGDITRIGIETFTTLKPDAILLLTETPEIIAQRRKSRDGLECHSEGIRQAQEAEVSYAQEVAALLAVDLFISTGSQDVDAAIDFIAQH